MLLRPATSTRWRVLAIALVTASAAAILWNNEDMTNQAAAYLPDMPSSFLTSRCSTTCAPDPFAKHGMMYWGNEMKYTRWIPFPPSAEGPIRRTKEIDARGKEAWEMDMEVLAHAAPAYTLAVKEQVDEKVGWARGKVVLVVGA
jgi:hypothetical protein